jgi:LPXTG-motif cell wall-anchored protein
MLKDAGKFKSEEDEWFKANMIQTPEGNWTFRDYTSHTLDFFYLERGAGRSNCTIAFNLPTMPKNSLVVGKELEAKTDDGSEALLDFLTGELDYTFEVLKVDANGKVTGESMFDLDNPPTYQIMENSVIVGGGTVNADGKFTLKAGQLAIFDGLLKGEEGRYVVRETLPSNLSGQYQGAEYDVVGAGGTSTGTIQDQEKQFAEYTTAPLDASETTTTVIFRNLVDARELSTLFVTKKIGGTETDIPDGTLFKMKILLGDENLAIGTPYKIIENIGTEEEIVVDTGTVGTDGIIQIERDQTIQVNGILQGTKVTVYEVNEDNYQVTYKGTITAAGENNGTLMSNDALGISGTVVNPKSDVKVTVTNSNYSMAVSVPISKTLQHAGTNEERTFHFNAYLLNEQMVPVDPEHPTASTSITIDTSDNGSNVGSANIGFGFGRTTPNGDYFYRINEVIDGQDDIDYDVSSYIVKITVSQNDRGEKKAEVTGITKYSDQTATTGAVEMETDEPLAFVNSKNGVLSLTKIVRKDGVAVTGDDYGNYTFRIEIPGIEDSTVTLKAGQTVTIKGLPIGATAKITELNTDGYAVSWSGKVSNDQTAYGPVAQTQPFNGDVVAVTCTNTTGPELPSTGGIGTNHFTTLGTILMLGAGVLLLDQRRRREGTSAT